MERRKEFLEFIRDRWSGARNLTSISLPAIISFLLAIQGKPYVLLVGSYLFLFLIVVINAAYILSLEDKEKGIFVGGKVRYSVKYPNLRVPAIGSLAFLVLTTATIAIVPPFRAPFIYSMVGLPTATPTITPTITRTSTNTPVPTSTSTSTPTPTATPKEQGIFYMFVLDASLKMAESFEEQTKWDAALRAVDSILVGLESGANYGLVTIGGAPGSGTANPCEEPSVLALPFSAREAVGARVGQLQPGGGGSLYTAFVLAVNQLNSLPDSTIRSIIYITGSEDACESQNEWRELERFFVIRGDSRLNIYSEIIIIDEKNGIRSQTIADRISSLSDKVNAQAPQTVFQLLQSNNTVINNISNYVEITIASIPIDTPTDTPPISTATRTHTPVSGGIVVPPSNTLPALPTFTLTSSLTPSLTPSLTFTSEPPPTQMPSVSLQLNSYSGPGESCYAYINAQVTNGPLTGEFRVWNKFYDSQSPAYDPYPNTLPDGSSANWQITLGGYGSPEYYRHRVWFVSGGIISNTLELICPDLTPSP